MAQEEDTDTALAEEIRQAHQKLKAAESLFLQKVGHELTADERKMAQLLAGILVIFKSKLQKWIFS